MVDRLQVGHPGLHVFMAWHRHTLQTNFTIQQSWSFEGVCIPLRLMNCLFPIPDWQPTATELFQSPLYESGTVFHSISYLLRHFLSSALAWRHTEANWLLQTRNYCCRAREVTLSFMDTLIALTYLHQQSWLTSTKTRYLRASKSIVILTDCFNLLANRFSPAPRSAVNTHLLSLLYYCCYFQPSTITFTVDIINDNKIINLWQYLIVISITGVDGQTGW